AQRLGEVPGVRHAAPRMEQTVMITAPNGDATGVLARGVRVDDLPEGVREPEWSAGSLQDFATGIAIGEGVAQKLAVTAGDTVTLITPPNKDTAFGRISTRRGYPVAYVFRVGYYPYDSQMVFLPLDEAQGLFNQRGAVDQIEIMVTEPDALAADSSD